MTFTAQWIASELQAIDALGDKPHEKGKRLETLVTAIFSEVEGLQFHSANTLNFFKTEEIDLFFWNNQERQGLHFLECALIVECKSSSTPLSGRDLRYFAESLGDKGRSNGILVALAGIAGDEQKSTAGYFHHAIALARGVTVLVVTREDLLTLKCGNDLVALLRLRLMSLVSSQVM